MTTRTKIKYILMSILMAIAIWVYVKQVSVINKNQKTCYDTGMQIEYSCGIIKHGGNNG
jgi:YbbR domain-containing protein